ncbi:hypothetical protein ACEQPO_11200 [Bacillus sp. SL00103]
MFIRLSPAKNGDSFKRDENNAVEELKQHFHVLLMFLSSLSGLKISRRINRTAAFKARSKQPFRKRKIKLELDLN